MNKYYGLFLILTLLFSFACAPRVSEHYFDEGVLLFEQGEYYQAIQEFNKYPEKHRLYDEAQSYKIQARQILDEKVSELLNQASNKWRDGYLSEAIKNYYQILAKDPGFDNIHEIIREGEEALETSIMALGNQFEDARRQNDIFQCKQIIEKMIRMSPGHDITETTRKNYQALKDIVLQKSYLLVEEIIRSGRSDDIEKAELQVEYMQGIDENDQRTILIGNKLQEHIEQEKQRADRARQQQRRQRLQQIFESGTQEYQKGNLKEAIEIWERARREGIADNTLNNWLNTAKRELSQLVLNYIQQGEFYFEMEDYTSARELFERAIDLDPNNEKAKDYIQKIIILKQ